MSKSCNVTGGPVIHDGLCLSGLRPSLLDNLGRKCWNHSYGYASSIFAQPCLSRTHPLKCVGNVFEQPPGWPEGRKAGCLESFRTLVQFPG